MKKSFTLSEILIVIAILAILTSMIFPNVSDFKTNSIATAMNSNIRNIQTAVDIYKIDNNKYPTVNEPEFGSPELIVFSEIYPKYIKNLPNEGKIPNQRYWVDYTGRVWGATVDAPSDIYGVEGKLEWSQHNEVIGYNLYKAQDKTTGSLKKSFSFIEQIMTQKDSEKIQIDVDEAGEYLISAVDRYGLETAPVNMGYAAGTDLNSSKQPFQPILMEEGEFYFEINSECHTTLIASSVTVDERMDGKQPAYNILRLLENWRV